VTNEQIDTWITELRSGNWRQDTDGELNSSADKPISDRDQRFCCIGVAASLFVAEEYKALAVTDSTDAACELLNIPFDNVKNAEGWGQQIGDALVNMNDGGKDFNAIADYIEAHRKELLDGENGPDQRDGSLAKGNQAADGSDSQGHQQGLQQ